MRANRPVVRRLVLTGASALALLSLLLGVASLGVEGRLPDPGSIPAEILAVPSLDWVGRILLALGIVVAGVVGASLPTWRRRR